MKRTVNNVYVYTDHTGAVSVYSGPIRAMKAVLKCIPRNRERTAKFVTGSGEWADSQEPQYWAKVLVRPIQK